MAERIECPECHKRVKNLKLHFRHSHPELMQDAFGESPKPQPEPQEMEQSQQQEQQPDLLEKLRMLGIEPDQVLQALSPLVEASVVKTLEKMQLGEAINKKVSEVETKLSGQINQTLQPLQQAISQPPGGDTQPQNTQLRDTILAGLAQKLLNPNSGSGSLEQLTKTLEMARAVSEAFYKPVLEAQAYTRKEVSDTLKMLRDAGATPDAARDTIIKRTGS